MKIKYISLSFQYTILHVLSNLKQKCHIFSFVKWWHLRLRIIQFLSISFSENRNYGIDIQNVKLWFSIFCCAVDKFLYSLICTIFKLCFKINPDFNSINLKFIIMPIFSHGPWCGLRDHVLVVHCKFWIRNYNTIILNKRDSSRYVHIDIQSDWATV